MAAARRLIACASAASLAWSVAGCATHSPSGLADRLTVQGEPSFHIGGSAPGKTGLDPEVRKQLETPRPARNAVETVEQWDAGLAEARTALALAPTAAHYRQVAEAYRRLGILDAAFDNFSSALAVDARDAAALDGRARVWRDWGFPHAGLEDAYAAIRFAPTSAVPFNTLGTLLYHLGRIREARGAFEQALAREPAVDYARQNLCQMVRLEGDDPAAVTACQTTASVDHSVRDGVQ